MDPGEAISIRKPDVYFVAAVAFENRVIGHWETVSLKGYGLNL